MKKFLIGILLFLGFFITSCNKKDNTSTMELEGTWEASNSETTVTQKWYLWENQKKEYYISKERKSSEKVSSGTLTGTINDTIYNYSGTKITKQISINGTSNYQITFYKKGNRFEIIEETTRKWEDNATFQKNKIEKSEKTSISGTYFLNQKNSDNPRGTKIICSISNLEIDEKTIYTTTYSGNTTEYVTDSTKKTKFDYTGDENTIFMHIVEATGKKLEVETEITIKGEITNEVSNKPSSLKDISEKSKFEKTSSSFLSMKKKK
ncbi:MAG: hypothetical protein SNJ64_04945 [Endomicrobiia bacterium]